MSAPLPMHLHLVQAYGEVKAHFDRFASQLCFTNVDTVEVWHLAGVELSAFLVQASDGRHQIPPFSSLPTSSITSLTATQSAPCPVFIHHRSQYLPISLSVSYVSQRESETETETETETESE